MATNLFNGTIDLGPTVEMFRAFRHFGQLSPGTDYGFLHAVLGATLAEKEGIAKDDLKMVAAQAKQFAHHYAGQLDDQEKWILGQLSKD